MDYIKGIRVSGLAGHIMDLSGKNMREKMGSNATGIP